METKEINGILSHLKSIDDKELLFNLCSLIAPKSIAKTWSKAVLIETIEDVLLSRY